MTPVASADQRDSISPYFKAVLGPPSRWVLSADKVIVLPVPPGGHSGKSRSNCHSYVVDAEVCGECPSEVEAETPTVVKRGVDVAVGDDEITAACMPLKGLHGATQGLNPHTILK